MHAIKNTNTAEIKEIVVKCKFDKSDCNYNDFEVTKGLIGRMCYRFNSGRNASNQMVPVKTSTRNDINMGLLFF